MSIRSQFTPEQRKLYRPRIIKRNTILWHDGDDKVVRLHSTDIVRIKPDGTVILRSGGWKTMTTRDRMNDHIHGYVIWQKSHKWYVGPSSYNPLLWVKRPKVEYFDGMRIPQDVRRNICTPTRTSRQRKS